MNDVSSFPWKSTFLSECDGFVKVHHFLPTYDYMSSNFKILCLVVEICKCYTFDVGENLVPLIICNVFSIHVINPLCKNLPKGEDNQIFARHN